MRVMIVGTEITQGFTVGIATQVPSGRVWETQPVRHHVRHPRDRVSRIVLYAGKKPVNLNTKLPWPESWRLAKVYLRPDSWKWHFPLSEGYLSGLTARGWPELDSTQSTALSGLILCW